MVITDVLIHEFYYILSNLTWCTHAWINGWRSLRNFHLFGVSPCIYGIHVRYRYINILFLMWLFDHHCATVICMHAVAWGKQIFKAHKINSFYAFNLCIGHRVHYVMRVHHAAVEGIKEVYLEHLHCRCIWAIHAAKFVGHVYSCQASVNFSKGNIYVHYTCMCIGIKSFLSCCLSFMAYIKLRHIICN